jgi:hypothetical protein
LHCAELDARGKAMVAGVNSVGFGRQVQILAVIHTQHTGCISTTLQIRSQSQQEFKMSSSVSMSSIIAVAALVCLQFAVRCAAAYMIMFPVEALRWLAGCAFVKDIRTVHALVLLCFFSAPKVLSSGPILCNYVANFNT